MGYSSYIPGFSVTSLVDRCANIDILQSYSKSIKFTTIGQSKIMSDFHQFAQKIQENNELKEKLLATHGQSEFANAAVILGSEHGYSFTEAEVIETLSIQKKKGDKKISDEELDQAVGGFSFSYTWEDAIDDWYSDYSNGGYYNQ